MSALKRKVMIENLNYKKFEYTPMGLKKASTFFDKLGGYAHFLREEKMYDTEFFIRRANDLLKELEALHQLNIYEY